MSADSPPPKPKIGSLRDRIKAFEQKPADNPPPPAPRPRPSGTQWKPKVAPPAPTEDKGESPSNSGSPERKSIRGGMSVADAKESIGLGGSLKERMAALQGRAAFNTAPAPPPPKPLSEKPKWKPPVILPSEQDQDKELGSSIDKHDELSSPVQKDATQSEDSQTNPEVSGEGHDSQPDPEEEERQRRAAIAARMARIGGARVGMGPPIFAPKPRIKKPETPKDEVSSSVIEDAPKVQSSQKENEDESTPIDATVRPEVERNSSIDSANSENVNDVPSASHSPPLSMPIPLVPRRAGPPRRKSAKSPAPSTGSDQQAVSNEAEAATAETPTDKAIPEAVESHPAASATDETQDAFENEEKETSGELTTVHDDLEVSPELPEPPHTDHEDEEASVEQEEDEASRRKRIAERIANSGGLNPFAGPLPSVHPISTAPNDVTPIADKADTASEGAVASRDLHTEEQANTADPLIDDSQSHITAEEETSTNVVADAGGEERQEEKQGTEEKQEDQDDQPLAGDFVISHTGIEGTQAENQPQGQVAYEERESVSELVEPEEVHASDSSHELEISTSRPIVQTSELRVVAQLDIESPQDFHRPKVRRPLPTAPAVDAEGGTEFVEERAIVAEACSPPPIENIPEPPVRPARRSIPPPMRPPPPVISVEPRVPLHAEDVEDDPTENQDEDEGQEVFIRPSAEADTIPEPQATPADPRFPHRSTFPPPPVLPSNRLSRLERPVSLSPDRGRRSDSFQKTSKDLSPTPHVQSSSLKEILDEADGDPIDPSFIKSDSLSSNSSLSRSEASEQLISTTSSVRETEDAEAVEQTRRRSIAERMAKLGGIKFGAPMPSARTPISPATPNRLEQVEDVPEERVEKEGPPRIEEDEEVRRARIAAKLAGMGGMRMGILPPSAPPSRALPVPKDRDDESPSSRPDLQPLRAVPPPVPMTTSEFTIPSEYEQESRSPSDSDLVEVNADESEIDEVSHRDADEVDDDEEIPNVPSMSQRPSVPDRNASRFVEDLPPPLPPGRHTVPSRENSQRKESGGPIPLQMERSTSSDYVMVDEPVEDEEVPPLPMPRRSIPPRTSWPQPPSSPPPPPPVSEKRAGRNTSSEWRLPDIPSGSLDFVQSKELEASLMEVSIAYPPPSTEHDAHSGHEIQSSPSNSRAHVTGTVGRGPDGQLSGDDLLALWGRVGVHVGQAATQLHEKSRKMLIGDGTYPGFVNAALSQVQNVSVPSKVTKHSYGYLIYHQTAGIVQKRASEILPGDIISLENARFKGHKGLHGYQQNVGCDGEPLVGIIGEYDPKKSKVKVFEANQHVGSQTVELTSYRFEDLKSGVIMVFRVSDN